MIGRRESPRVEATLNLAQPLSGPGAKLLATVGLSSAESELYAAIKASGECLGITAMFKDWGIDTDGQVKVDASAALGIISRTGLGRTRLIDVQYLYIQQLSAKKALRFGKVSGNSNAAELMTKHLNREVLARHSRDSNIRFIHGRAERATQLV